MQTECEKVNLHLSNNFKCIGSCVCLVRCLWIFIANPPPGAQLRLTVDLPLIFFSPTILSCLCCLVVVVMLLLFSLCTHFSCWRWCTDLCVSFIANPPPGAQLRLTVDLPLIVSRYRTSDIPFAEKPRNIFCYLDKYIDNFWQWFGKIQYIHDILHINATQIKSRLKR